MRIYLLIIVYQKKRGIFRKVSFGVPTMFAKNEKEIEGQPVRRTNQNISNSGIIEIWNRQRL